MASSTAHRTSSSLPDRLVLAICGLSGAGKTTICKELKRYGYKVISASQVAAELYRATHGTEPTRWTLAEFGLKILSTRLEEEFLQKLLAELPDTGNVAIDGLRSALTLDHIRRHYGAICIYVERRASKYAPRGHEASVAEPELMRLLDEVDSHLLGSNTQYDLSIENEDSAQAACRKVLRFVSRFTADLGDAAHQANPKAKGQ